MPQSLNVTVKETHNIPEHAAEAAAASKDHSITPTGHEETVTQEEHKTNMKHGHAAGVEHSASLEKK